MQRSPAAPKAAAEMCWAAKSRSESGMTMAWLFAPPRAWTRLPWVTPVFWTMWATGVEPTKEIASIPGCSRTLETMVRLPETTLKTPSGRPASL